MENKPTLFIGQRFAFEGYIGTIKYIGQVGSTKGEWVGVEWDDPTRGRHNGSKDGISYFTCLSETGGSFLRPHKVELGVSFWKALLGKYTQSNVEDEHLILSSGGGKTMLETVGMKKVQKQFEKLSELKYIGLCDQQVSHLGLEGQLRDNCGNTTENIDLSKNLLSSWKDLAEITGELPNLSVLNLSNNVMNIPENCVTLSNSFSALKTLILNSCRVTWIDVASCLQMWPQIEELHLGNNEISDIPTLKEGEFSSLKFLDLSNNYKIKNWSNINALSGLKLLHTLLLANCGLVDCKIDEHDFENLKKISLVGNKYDSLDVLNQLNNLQNLEEIIFRSNPITAKESAESFRELIIAKVKNAKIINRSEVKHAERQGAEIDYLKNFGEEWRGNGGHQDPELNKPSDEFLKCHPRYMPLIEKYGAPADTEIFKKSTALSSSLLFVNMSVPSCPDIKTITKKLPSSMTVGRIKVLIQHVLKPKISNYVLVAVSQFNKDHIIPMDKDSDTLHSLSFDSGDFIQVWDKAEYRDHIFNRRMWHSKALLPNY